MKSFSSEPGDQAAGGNRNQSGRPAPFIRHLAGFGLEMTRFHTDVLQVNLGRLCNQSCEHCHLEAGPDRKEVMSAETMKAVEALARVNSFQVIDFTGGSPELVPGLLEFMDRLAYLAPRLIFRTNLTAWFDHGPDDLPGRLKKNQVVIEASLPSLNRDQVAAQRGPGVWEKSLAALRRLNDLGYGLVSGLELNLVSNPVGTDPPPSQSQAEETWKRELFEKQGLSFNHLRCLANVPLGRFGQWLRQSGGFEAYLAGLAARFNPLAVAGLMCRTQVSISWDGWLYDCDFNLAAGIPLGSGKTHITEIKGPPPAGTPIARGDHCYACTAGTGFT
ncbi:MAG: arsenosugar biosynthesis radical SAM (seleno)protein ArsS [Thermodesulfobacteriota bacterium]